MLNWTAWLRAVQQKAATKLHLPSQTWLSISSKLRGCNHNNTTNNNSNRNSNSNKPGAISGEARTNSQQTSQHQHTEDCTKGKQKSNVKPKSPSILNIYKNAQKPKASRWGYGYSLVVGGICGSVMWAIYEMGKPEQDHMGRSIEDELSGLSLPQQYLQRMWHSLQYYQKMLEEPLPIRLLPDILQPPYIQPRYTLVLEMKDVLVHPDWTYQTGWRFKKRPGVDHFLKQCSKHFEIVVYTSEQGMTAFPILDALDPNGYIRYRLVRGATQLVDGQHIKNLNRLNRNLRRLIVVDWDRRAVPLHPDNIFAITRWMGNDDDVQLFDLAAFLSLIAEHEMDDVREVLHYYSQFEDPIDQFKENQRKLLELKQEKPDVELKPKC